MKKASPHKRTGRPKLPGFFDHFFYWTWRSCRHGFPDRSFAVISVVQFACLLFPVAVVLQFLDTPAVRFLYETDDRLTLFPLILTFPVLLWRNMRIYTGERYRMMHDFYGAFHVSVRQRYRLRFLVCTVLAVLAILLEIWLFTLYHDRCTAISSGNSHPASLYVPYRYDNGNDSVQEGVYRIVDEKGRIGYADEHGNTLIEPRFAFGFPFENGKAKVTDTGEQKEVPGSDGDKWLVQGAAIFIYIAAPCTTEIHTENQYFTLLVKPLVQHRFLHRLLLLCFSCNPVIPKNKKSPETFPFFGQNPYICISSKSKAKQCSETRTATKSLPATELSTL